MRKHLFLEIISLVLLWSFRKHVHAIEEDSQYKQGFLTKLRSPAQR